MRAFYFAILWVVAVLVASHSQSAAAYSVAFSVGSVLDESRSREIAYTLYYPQAFSGEAYILLFSHGGAGSSTGHTRYRHFGERWAAEGYVGLHVNHLESAPLGTHRIDRPADISFVLDALQSGALVPPPSFGGTLLLDRFGHAGHSYGAYTAMALAGGDFLFAPVFHDPRIVAIAPISPQGPGQFGAFDNFPLDNTWANISIPAFNIIGAEEKDTNAIGTISEEDWRLTPFDRYPALGDKLQVILPGLDHDDLGAFPTETIAAYLGENTRLFFDVYLRGSAAGVCALAQAPELEGQILDGLPEIGAGVAEICPPPIGVPEPPLPESMLFAALSLSFIAKCKSITRKPIESDLASPIKIA